MPDIVGDVIRFQCSRCGFELERTIGLLGATEALPMAALPGPNEITIEIVR